jgi:hypothetical protein
MSLPRIMTPAARTRAPKLLVLTMLPALGLVDVAALGALEVGELLSVELTDWVLTAVEVAVVSIRLLEILSKILLENLLLGIPVPGTVIMVELIGTIEPEERVMFELGAGATVGMMGALIGVEDEGLLTTGDETGALEEPDWAAAKPTAATRTIDSKRILIFARR